MTQLNNVLYTRGERIAYIGDNPRRRSFLARSATAGALGHLRLSSSTDASVVANPSIPRLWRQVMFRSVPSTSTEPSSALRERFARKWYGCPA
jgi:hypothetical protein